MELWQASFLLGALILAFTYIFFRSPGKDKTKHNLILGLLGVIIIALLIYISITFIFIGGIKRN